MIKAGYNAEIDELRFEMTDGKGIIARVEAAEKERTGIKNLKVGYNRVFGYYIEISRAYTGEIPQHYIRKQTLANAERYITQELKELEARVLGAQDRWWPLNISFLPKCAPQWRQNFTGSRGRPGKSPSSTYSVPWPKWRFGSNTPVRSST